MGKDGPDGWGVVHDNPMPGPENVPEYMFGPFPAKELADLISANSTCACRTRVIPLFFPSGIKMALSIPLDADEDDEPDHGPIH